MNNRGRRDPDCTMGFSWVVSLGGLSQRWTDAHGETVTTLTLWCTQRDIVYDKFLVAWLPQWGLGGVLEGTVWRVSSPDLDSKILTALTPSWAGPPAGSGRGFWRRLFSGSSLPAGVWGWHVCHRHAGLGHEAASECWVLVGSALLSCPNVLLWFPVNGGPSLYLLGIPPPFIYLLINFLVLFSP